MGKWSAPGSPVALVAGLLVLALCTVVAASGASVRWPDADRVRQQAQERTEDPAPDRDTGGDAVREEGDDDVENDLAGPPRWILPGRLAALALLVASVLLVVSVLARLRIGLRRRRPPPEPRTTVDLPAPTDAEAEEVEALTEALEGGLADLATGPPRNSIVAAWLRLEAAAESDRFRRDPADTPSEFAAHVLASYALDGEAIERLAALYREARFSRHPISERQRDDALACLAALLAGLPVPHRGGAR